MLPLKFFERKKSGLRVLGITFFKNFKTKILIFEYFPKFFSEMINTQILDLDRNPEPDPGKNGSYCYAKLNTQIRIINLDKMLYI